MSITKNIHEAASYTKSIIVTDMAIPDQLESISHEEVVAVANKTRPKFINLVKGILKEVKI